MPLTPIGVLPIARDEFLLLEKAVAGGQSLSRQTFVNSC
jgi:hypothetical protein